MHLKNTFKKELTTCLKLKLHKMHAKFYFAVISFRSRSGLTFCQSWSGSTLFAKVVSRRQKSASMERMKVSLFPGLAVIYF